MNVQVTARDIPPPPPPKPKREVTITLDESAAGALRTVCRNIGGNQRTSYRLVFTKIEQQLERAGIARVGTLDAVPYAFNSMYFVEGEVGDRCA